jgi:AcrR family transcriptional regulator
MSALKLIRNIIRTARTEMTAVMARTTLDRCTMTRAIRSTAVILQALNSGGQVVARGRRRGNPDTRAEILDASRREFAAVGYERATVRGIAAGAGVDPSLVIHYFGSKEQLFAESLDFPANPAAVMRGVLAASDGAFGAQLITTVLTVWDDQRTTSPLIAVFRSATGEGVVHDLVREFFQESVLDVLEEEIGAPDARLRAGLIASQLMGLLVGRYLLELDALAAASPPALAAVIGPVIDHYAHADLSTPPAPPATMQ